MGGSVFDSSSAVGPRVPVSRLRQALLVLAFVQLVAIAFLSFWSVWRYPIFGLDEAAHLSYAGWVAEHHSIPSLYDRSLWQAQALFDGTYPRPSGKTVAQDGLAAENYEAFQPPLYYVLAAPVYAIPHGFIEKIRAVRVFDALLYIAGALMLALVVRAIFGSRWLLAYIAGLTVLLWPGNLTQSVTVSNLALEWLVAFSLVYAAGRATSARSDRWLLLAAGAYGLCLLTSLNLGALGVVLLVPLVGAWRRAARKLLLVATVALPALMIVPWLVVNQVRYGDLTAQRVIKEQQMSTVNPTHASYGVHQVLLDAWNIRRAFLPQQWWADIYLHSASAALLVAIVLLVILAGLARAVDLVRRREWRLPLTLAGPWVTGVLLLSAGALVAQWPLVLPRYLAPEYALLGVLAPPSTNHRRVNQVVSAAIGLLTLATLALWVHYGNTELRARPAHSAATPSNGWELPTASAHALVASRFAVTSPVSSSWQARVKR